MALGLKSLRGDFAGGVALIALSQLPHVFSVTPETLRKPVLEWLAAAQPLTAAASMATAVIVWLVAWRWRRSPAALIGLVAGTAVYYLIRLAVPSGALGPVIGALPVGLPLPTALAGMIDVIAQPAAVKHFPALVASRGGDRDHRRARFAARRRRDRRRHRKRAIARTASSSRRAPGNLASVALRRCRRSRFPRPGRFAGWRAGGRTHGDRLHLVSGARSAAGRRRGRALGFTDRSARRVMLVGRMEPGRRMDAGPAATSRQANVARPDSSRRAPRSSFSSPGDHRVLELRRRGDRRALSVDGALHRDVNRSLVRAVYDGAARPSRRIYGPGGAVGWTPSRRGSSSSSSGRALLRQRRAPATEVEGLDGRRRLYHPRSAARDRHRRHRRAGARAVREAPAGGGR